MDPLTHTATGLFLSRAGLHRATPRALPILLLAANAPDIDIVSLSGGSLAYLDYHRYITHALAFAPLLALAPVALVALFSRKPLRWKGAYAISLAGVASHLALDATNAYGIRLLLPFSPRWLRWDLTSVVDVWIWAVLALALLAPLLVRLVATEIGARDSHSGRGFAWLALFFLLFYNAAHAVLHARAVAVLDSRIYNGAAPARVAAFPNLVNPLRWRGLVETPDTYSVHPVNLLGEFEPAAGAVWYKPERGPAIEAAERTRPFRDFARFAQFPLYRVIPIPEPENGTRVELVDLRFGEPQGRAFRAVAILDARNRVLQAWFQFGT